ncbi:MAG: U32 family peptidase [Clostridia bacterium]|nr:U32 family peptidase [Clostridia bacterium]
MPELLSPAGNFEKMKAALLYGADAVYLAGNLFGMRSAADNFSLEELYAASEYVHERSKKMYLTLNTMPRGYEYAALERYLHEIKNAGIDAMIIADLGVLDTVKRIIPDMEIHISTQSSAVSAAACRAYYNLGAKRVVLARELSLEEIIAIKQDIPSELEIEAFVHGSMCVSYSGRCTLSNYLTGRDANRGACTQPCRWNYALVEEKRPDVPLPIEQTPDGTFIFGSKDMCTIQHIPALVESGIDSFKIEGRMKSAYYTAVVTNAYRMALDAYAASPGEYKFNEAWLRELESVSHREYCTGYYFDHPLENAQLGTQNGYIRDKAYFATALDAESVSMSKISAEVEIENENGRLYPFIQRNKVSQGDMSEMISPGKCGREFCVSELYSEKGERIESAPHPAMIFFARVPFEVREGDIMRAAN